MMRNAQIDEKALADVEQRMMALAAWQNMACAKALFEVASIDATAPGALSASDNLDFQSELMPWRIRGFARNALATMRIDGIDDWLLGMLAPPGKRRGKDDAESEAQRRADAALRVLGTRGGASFRTALERVTGNYPAALRLRAVDVPRRARLARFARHVLRHGGRQATRDPHHRGTRHRQGTLVAHRRDRSRRDPDRDRGPSRAGPQAPRPCPRARQGLASAGRGRRESRRAAHQARDPGADRRLRSRTQAQEGTVGDGRSPAPTAHRHDRARDPGR